jgi:hypothetical protein
MFGVLNHQKNVACDTDFLWDFFLGLLLRKFSITPGNAISMKIYFRLKDKFLPLVSPANQYLKSSKLLTKSLIALTLVITASGVSKAVAPGEPLLVPLAPGDITFICQQKPGTYDAELRWTINVRARANRNERIRAYQFRFLTSGALDNDITFPAIINSPSLSERNAVDFQYFVPGFYNVQLVRQGNPRTINSYVTYLLAGRKPTPTGVNIPCFISDNICPSTGRCPSDGY